MNIFKRFFCTLLPAATAFSLIQGCEQSVPTPDLLYVDQLIVSSFIYADSSEIVVNVSHSLPLNADYTFEKAALADADVSIQTPEGLLHLVYDSTRWQYHVAYSPSTSPSQYTLNVHWHGKTATATTTVHQTPTVDSVSVRWIPNEIFPQQKDLALKAYFQSNAKATFATSANFFVQNGADSNIVDTNKEVARFLPRYRSVIRGVASDTGTVMDIDGSADIVTFPGPDTALTYIMRFVALDAPYYDFYRSYGNTRDVSIFGSFGTNPAYNIKGDAVGLFMGVSRSTRWYVVTVKH